EPPRPQRPGELPRRRRQQHLAPELKRRVDEQLAAQGRVPPVDDAPPRPAPPEPATPLGAPVPADAAPPPPPPADERGGGAVPADGTVPEGDAARSPETMRSMMSAMQRGWQRG